MITKPVIGLLRKSTAQALAELGFTTVESLEDAATEYGLLNKAERREVEDFLYSIKRNGKPSIEQRTSAFSQELMCSWRQIWPVDQKTIALMFEVGHCCDMRGVVAVATRLMPELDRIITFQGNEPDTEFRLLNGEWHAFCWVWGDL
jgi:hypothetical protein